MYGQLSPLQVLMNYARQNVPAGAQGLIPLQQPNMIGVNQDVQNPGIVDNLFSKQLGVSPSGTPLSDWFSKMLQSSFNSGVGQ